MCDLLALRASLSVLHVLCTYLRRNGLITAAFHWSCKIRLVQSKLSIMFNNVILLFELFPKKVFIVFRLDSIESRYNKNTTIITTEFLGQRRGWNSKFQHQASTHSETGEKMPYNINFAEKSTKHAPRPLQSYDNNILVVIH